MAKLTRIPCVATVAAVLLLGYVPAAFGHEVSLSCPTAFGPVPDASGLIAYYPLDGNTADVSGNGMDAIEVNAANPAEGKVGQGYHFNGKDSYIRLPVDISPFAYSQITITAWIKPEALNGARYVFNQGDHGNRNLFISNGKVSAGKALVGNPKHTIYADRWTFVALSYDQATGTAVLLSGSTISTLDKVVIPEQPRPSVLLGAKAPGNSGFAGVIDEVRIYNRALTTTELAGLSRAGSGTTVAGSISPNQLPGDQFGGGIPTQRSAPQGINTPSISTSNPFGDDAQSIGPTGQPGNGDSSQPGILSENMCATIECPLDYICVDGTCYDDPNGPKTSVNAENACADVNCPNGQICLNGGCFDDPNGPKTSVNAENACADVNCPNGQICLNGGCFDDPNSLDGTSSSVRESNSALPGVPSYDDQAAPLPSGAILTSVDEANDAVAYPQTDVFAPSNAGDSVGDGVAPSSSQPGIPVFDENPTQLPGDQFGRVNPTQLPGDQFADANPAQLPGDQFESVSPTQLPGDQSERISAEDIPTGPEYQILEQQVMVEATMLMPESTSSESSGSGSGEMRTTQQGLSGDAYLAFDSTAAVRTSISGGQGQIVKSDTGARAADMGIEKIQIREVANHPCRIRTGDRGIVIDTCLKNQLGKTGSWKEAAFSNRDRNFRVVGIQVCTRKSNDRVKGLRIRGQQLGKNGLIDVYEREQFTRPNCNDNWKNWVSCPAGKIATGFRAHFDQKNNSDPSLVGLQLYCRGLTLVRKD